MDKRKLGNSGLEIAPLIFGGNVLGWTADAATSFKLLDGFVAAGFEAIDTADVYSKWVPGHQGGESETIIGNWLKARGNRSKVVIATKVGMEMPGIGQGLRRAYIMARVEDSLKRLQTDYIDLYQSHSDDKEAPLEETLGAYQRLIEQGKVRAIGASNYEAPRLAAALKTSATDKLPRYETLQPLYNLSDRAPYESALAPCVCARTSASSPTTPWPPGSSPASTVPRPTFPRARAAVAWRATSTTGVAASSRRSTRWRRALMPNPVRWPLPGCAIVRP